MDKGKGRARDEPPARNSLPTPESGESSDARGQKRKRVEARAQRDREEDDADAGGEEGEGAGVEAKFNKYFDPNQDPEERRDLKKRSRALERGFAGAWSNDLADLSDPTDF